MYEEYTLISTHPQIKHQQNNEHIPNKTYVLFYFFSLPLPIQKQTVI